MVYSSRVRLLGSPGPAQVVVPMSPEDWGDRTEFAAVAMGGSSSRSQVGPLRRTPWGDGVWTTDATDDPSLIDRIEVVDGIPPVPPHVPCPTAVLRHFEDDPAWTFLVNTPGTYRFGNDFGLNLDHDYRLGRTQTRLIASRPNTADLTNYPVHEFSVGGDRVFGGVHIGDGMSIPHWIDPVNYGISLDWMDYFGYQPSDRLTHAWADQWIQQILDHLEQRTSVFEDYPLAHPWRARSTGMHHSFQPIQNWALAAMQLGRPDLIRPAMECMREWALRPHHHIPQGRRWENGKISAMDPDEEILRYMGHPGWRAIQRGVPHREGTFFLKPYDDRHDYEARYAPMWFGQNPEDRAHSATFGLQWVARFAWSHYWRRELEWAKEGIKPYTMMSEGEERGGGRYFLDLGSLRQQVPDDDSAALLGHRSLEFTRQVTASGHGPVDVKPPDKRWDPDLPTVQNWQGFIWGEGAWRYGEDGSTVGDAGKYLLWLAENTLHQMPDGSWRVKYSWPVNATWDEQNRRWLPMDGEWPLKFVEGKTAFLDVNQSMGGIWVAAVLGSEKARMCFEWLDSLTPEQLDNSNPNDPRCWAPHQRPWIQEPPPDPVPDPDLITVSRTRLMNAAATTRSTSSVIATELEKIANGE